MTSSPDPLHSLESLIEHFEQNLYALKSPQYSEAQIRQEFIIPLFALLGWDMDIRQGYAEAHKDVIHEDAIQVGGVHQGSGWRGGTALVGVAWGVA